VKHADLGGFPQCGNPHFAGTLMIKNNLQSIVTFGRDDLNSIARSPARPPPLRRQAGAAASSVAQTVAISNQVY
jgi:hypothetical protein